MSYPGDSDQNKENQMFPTNNSNMSLCYTAYKHLPMGLLDSEEFMSNANLQPLTLQAMNLVFRKTGGSR